MYISWPFSLHLWPQCCSRHRLSAFVWWVYPHDMACDEGKCCCGKMSIWRVKKDEDAIFFTDVESCSMLNNICYNFRNSFLSLFLWLPISFQFFFCQEPWVFNLLSISVFCLSLSEVQVKFFSTFYSVSSFTFLQNTDYINHLIQNGSSGRNLIKT